MRLLRWAVLPALLVPLAWLLFANLGTDPSVIRSRAVGRAVPSLPATTLDGATLPAEQLGGRPMLVNFWASWCGPCVDEHPVLLDAAQRYGDRLLIVDVLYNDTASNAEAWLRRYGDGGWPHLLDADGRTALEFGVTAPPETYFVDADGVVRDRWIGPLTTAGLDAKLAALGLDR